MIATTITPASSTDSSGSSSSMNTATTASTTKIKNACHVEPTVGFGEAMRDRAVWLVGLLVLQSASGIILAQNEALLEKHPVSE